MKKQYISIFLMIAILCAGYFTFSAIFSKNSITSTENSVIPLNSVLIADTPALRELGLSSRDSLPEESGMLFVFEQPDTYNFWMKDMKFPIDIIWLDDSFKVLHVEKEVSPETYPKTFGPQAKSSFVLEVNAKIAKKNNYTEGSTLDFLKPYLHMK
jgi:uncharacterized membrane protein (UPF0127 family)